MKPGPILLFDHAFCAQRDAFDSALALWRNSIFLKSLPHQRENVNSPTIPGAALWEKPILTAIDGAGQIKVSKKILFQSLYCQQHRFHIIQCRQGGHQRDNPHALF